eukprot:6962602-Alexandrium_andersonii.AAC.1
MSSLSAELLASRTSGATPKTSAPASSGEPSSSSPKPKHMPAAKYFPAKANFVKPPIPGVQQPQWAPIGHDVFTGPVPPPSEMKNTNAVNFEPPVQPSAPG